ncbi:MAG: DUF1992 domain-containing protein [Pseudomonadota bacterium]
MIPGFNKIIEERIRMAQERGDFEDLPGTGKPIHFDDDSHIPEDLRMAYKVMKNADFIPEEIALKKQIQSAQELVAGMPDSGEKYRAMRKLNYLVLKLNAMRQVPIDLETPQVYTDKIIDRLDKSGAPTTPDARRR